MTDKLDDTDPSSINEAPKRQGSGPAGRRICSERISMDLEGMDIPICASRAFSTTIVISRTSETGGDWSPAEEARGV